MSRELLNSRYDILNNGCSVHKLNPLPNIAKKQVKSGVKGLLADSSIGGVSQTLQTLCRRSDTKWPQEVQTTMHAELSRQQSFKPTLFMRRQTLQHNNQRMPLRSDDWLRNPILLLQSDLMRYFLSINSKAKKGARGFAVCFNRLLQRGKAG